MFGSFQKAASNLQEGKNTHGWELTFNSYNLNMLTAETGKMHAIREFSEIATHKIKSLI